MDVLSVLAGLALLFLGGEVLVRAAVAIAGRFNVSQIIVGLTIVAFGTSAPEFTVSLSAALVGQPDIAVGNVVGSNIANILLVLGVTALIQPLRPERQLVVRDGLFMFAVTIAMAALCLTGMVGSLQGALFIALLGVYIGICYWVESTNRSPVAVRHETEADEYGGLPPRLLVAFPLFLAGLAGVVLGADLLVSGATSIARALGVAEAVIGLSLVAIGTSLPELAVSAIAAYRGRGDIAVGNIIGSNIANILLIIGGTALVEPLTVTRQIAAYDAWIMVLAALVLLPVMVTGRVISRSEGAVFVIFFALYIASLYLGLPAYVIALTA